MRGVRRIDYLEGVRDALFGEHDEEGHGAFNDVFEGWLVPSRTTYMIGSGGVLWSGGSGAKEGGRGWFLGVLFCGVEREEGTEGCRPLGLAWGELQDLHIWEVSIQENRSTTASRTFTTP